MTNTNTITNSITTVDTCKNVDFFKADRELSERVSEFVHCIIHKKAIQAEYDAEIKKYNKKFESYDNLAGSYCEDEIPTLKQEALDKIQELKDEKQELLDKCKKFEYTDSDKEFRKSLRADGVSRKEIAANVCYWFDLYGLDISNTTFLFEIMDGIGKKTDMRTFVQSNGAKLLVVDANKALQCLYLTAYEYMIAAGTIKTADIPEVLREKYAKKPISKSAKKAMKKAKKKAANAVEKAAQALDAVDALRKAAN